MTDHLTFTGDDLVAPDLADRVAQALQGGVEAWFVTLPGDPYPFFLLRSCPGAILILDHVGQHLATYADVDAAMGCGWVRGGAWLEPSSLTAARVSTSEGKIS